MGYLEKRREKKWKNLTESTSQIPVKNDQAEKERQAREYQKKNRKRDIRKLVPVIVSIVIGGFLSRGLLTYLVSGSTALLIIVVTLILAFLTVWFITVRTYIPPGIDFFVAGHSDPDNIHSMIQMVDYHVPRELIASIDQDALNYPILRDYGPSNLCDSFKWDPVTGKVHVTPGWGANSEFEFATRHEVYHITREIGKVQARTINNYESYMDLEIEMRSYDRAVEMIDRIAASLFEPGDSKRLMESLREEIEADKRDLRAKIYGPSTKGSRNEGPMENEAITDVKQ